MEQKLSQEQEYFNLILNEYAEKVKKLEHMNIILKIENSRLNQRVQELTEKVE